MGDKGENKEQHQNGDPCNSEASERLRVVIRVLGRSTDTRCGLGELNDKQQEYYNCLNHFKLV